jgi:hypothetical protein
MSKHSNVQHASVSYKLSDVNDEDLRRRLEYKYLEFEVLRKSQVESYRAAQRAAAMASKAMAEVQLAELDFVIDAGEAFELITTEPNWITRRSGNGEVVLECLLTQSDIQNIARTQTKQIREQVKPDADDGDNDGNDLFRS